MAEPNKDIRQLHDNASPENVSSWRDLADQLTPEQVAELQDAEHRLRTQAASLPAGYPCDWPPRSESELADILLRAGAHICGRQSRRQSDPRRRTTRWRLAGVRLGMRDSVSKKPPGISRDRSGSSIGPTTRTTTTSQSRSGGRRRRKVRFPGT